MLSNEMQKAVCDQINYELYSAYLYLGMSAGMENLGYKGAAHWMRTQANEEMFHGAKLFDYVHSRDGKVTLGEIKKVKTEYKTILEAFESAFMHEKSVTERFCKLTDMALSSKDHVSNSVFQWFITEQIEEEDSVRTIVDRLKRIKDLPDALYQLDAELGTRALSPSINLLDTSGNAN
ncbi:MAG: ferritin [Victivallaceae bacterium]|jgi:ferritin|nr:ferritin [Victivallaceae bacterium]NLK84118.1 ferritin [Lentisphaerota bacterium]MDD3116159.1 ferritin [Victivallaceae bacterium]MDD3702971.1 ferritin [Victivallaceae bacterium]MDD4317424.1 ferritin [Victivallaceae bacterium]